MYGPQFNPYNYGMASPYQQRLNQLEQQPMYQQPMQPRQNPQILKGRVVGSIDEAKAAQVDLDGTVTYFASPGEGKIYAKSIGLNGLPVFLTYSIDEAEMPKQAIPVGNDLDKRLTALEAKVKEMYEHEHAANDSGTQPQP